MSTKLHLPPRRCVEIFFCSIPERFVILKYYCDMELIAVAVLFFVAGFVLGKYLGQQEHGEGGEAKEDALQDASVEQFGHLREPLLALHNVKGTVLDTVALDALLLMDELMSEETKRSRRSRTISDVNSWGWASSGKPILTREKDEDDRRRTLYVVGDFQLPVWVTHS